MEKGSGMLMLEDKLSCTERKRFSRIGCALKRGVRCSFERLLPSYWPRMSKSYEGIIWRVTEGLVHGGAKRSDVEGWLGLFCRPIPAIPMFGGRIWETWIREMLVMHDDLESAVISPSSAVHEV